MLSLLFAAMISNPSAPANEPYRPQYHFTAELGWLNDPNGLVYYKGEYHLFFQHNPFGPKWGNMTWGHAVSKDLVHWHQLANALHPDKSGTVYSGSAVVDHHNDSGFGTKENPPMVMFYTAAGGYNDESKGVSFTQGLAYSTDGRTFTKWDGNPIVHHIEAENRDPKVIWHEPSKSWIMALYLNDDRYELLRSPDLKHWTKTDDVTMPGAGECPDIFELPIAGEKGKKEWVFWSAAGKYRLGNFDGYKFKPTTEPIDSIFGPNSYAAQTYSDEPKGRRIQIGWMRSADFPGTQFNQQMTVPLGLTLKQTKDGPRLCTLPVHELHALREAKLVDKKNLKSASLEIQPGSDLVEMHLTAARDSHFTVTLGEETLTYNGSAGTVDCMGHTAKLLSDSGDVDFILYRDKASLEIFADGGLVNMPFVIFPKAPLQTIHVEASNLRLLQSYRLKSSRGLFTETK